MGIPRNISIPNSSSGLYSNREHDGKNVVNRDPVVAPQIPECYCSCEPGLGGHRASPPILPLDCQQAIEHTDLQEEIIKHKARYHAKYHVQCIAWSYPVVPDAAGQPVQRRTEPARTGGLASGGFGPI